MDLENFKNRWAGHQRRVEANLKINRNVIQEINLNEAKSEMRKLAVKRLAEVMCFLAAVTALWNFIASHALASAPTISALILSVFGTIGLMGTVRQIALVRRIDYSGPVTEIQGQLTLIRSHGIQVFRLLILSVPFYLTYVFLGYKVLFDVDLFLYADPTWLQVEIIVSLCLVVPTLWLYRELGLNTTRRRWIKQLIEGSGGRQTVIAIEFLQEIKEFKCQNR